MSLEMTVDPSQATMSFAAALADDSPTKYLTGKDWEWAKKKIHIWMINTTTDTRYCYDLIHTGLGLKIHLLLFRRAVEYLPLRIETETPLAIISDRDFLAEIIR